MTEWILSFRSNLCLPDWETALDRGFVQARVLPEREDDFVPVPRPEGSAGLFSSDPEQVLGEVALSVARSSTFQLIYLKYIELWEEFVLVERVHHEV